MSRARDIADGKFANELTVDTDTLKGDAANNTVGIGTSSPGFSNGSGLEVANATTACVRVEGNSAAHAVEIYADSNGGTIDARGSGAALAFDIGGSEAARINSSGKVGIGTSSPTSLLDVNGQTRISGRVLTGQGAVGSSGYGFAGDGNTCMFSSANNTLQFGTSGSERMRLDMSGNLLLGQNTTTQPGLSNTTAGLGINSTGRIFSSVNGAWSFFNRNNDNGQVIGFGRSGTGVGGIDVTASSTAFRTSSDHRLKQSVEDMTGAIDRVKALAPKRFQFTAEPDTTVDGFLAHEAQAVVPEAVSGTKDEVDDDGNAVMQGIDQSKLVPLLTGALQEAIAKIETLETKVAALEGAS